MAFPKKIILYLFLRYIRFALISFSVFIIIFALINIIDQIANIKVIETEWSGLPVLIGLFRVPNIIQQSSSFIILITSLFFFSSLAKSNELTIIRISGLSALRIISIPLCLGFILGCFIIIIFNPFATKSTSYALQLKNIAEGKEQQISQISSAGIWLRETTPQYRSIIHAKTYDQQKNILYDISANYFSNKHEYLGMLKAKSLILKKNNITFTKALMYSSDNMTNNKLETITLPSNLSFKAINETIKDKMLISIWQLPNYIKALDQAGLNSRQYRYLFHEFLTLPLKYMAMIFLAGFFTFGTQRVKNSFQIISVSLLSGFIIFFIFEISSAIAEAGVAQAFLACWLSTIAVFLFCFTLFMRIDLK